mmetsp:Transcript_2774/g.4884  ORF Transcript_2774/g.4884 Transcript_2774/m.4884 type:complete len:138 (-) Transcript_2774:2262-2675(-)
MMSDFKKIGIGLTSFGLFFTFLGVLLLFDKSLLAMGNVLFLSGVTLIIGAQRSVRFFLARRRWKGSACFFSGITLVLIGWPIIGTLVEAFGFVNLFGDFFPIVISFLRTLPVIGNILEHPYVQPTITRLFEADKLPV